MERFGRDTLVYQCDLRQCLPSVSCVVKWKCKSMAMEQCCLEVKCLRDKERQIRLRQKELEKDNSD